jgi:hypothetical protein
MARKQDVKFDQVEAFIEIVKLLDHADEMLGEMIPIVIHEVLRCAGDEEVFNIIKKSLEEYFKDTWEQEIVLEPAETFEGLVDSLLDAIQELPGGREILGEMTPGMVIEFKKLVSPDELYHYFRDAFKEYLEFFGEEDTHKSKFLETFIDKLMDQNLAMGYKIAYQAEKLQRGEVKQEVKRARETKKIRSIKSR